MYVYMYIDLQTHGIFRIDLTLRLYVCMHICEDIYLDRYICIYVYMYVYLRTHTVFRR